MARVIIDSAKVKNQYIQLTGTNGSAFIPVSGEPLEQTDTLVTIEQAVETLHIHLVVLKVFYNLNV